MKYFKVAVSAPLPEPLVYKSEDSQIHVGSVVNVPLGSRKAQGLVVSLENKKPSFEVKDILSVEADLPPLSEIQIQWIQWMSRYYFYPIGRVAHLCFPSKKFKLKETKIEAKQFSLSTLNEEQEKCVRDIRFKSDFNVHLLHGVTGSGKTEVYFHLIDDQIQKGKQVLVMVPEISLTSQLHSRFSNQFHEHVGILHSGFKGKKRYQEWIDFVSGRKKVLLGARSALFCPLPNLSMIIVDEEHEVHFKQEEKLKYQARDAALMLAKMRNIPIVLGSATPSLTTWEKAKKGVYQYHHLKNRFKNRPFPKVQIVDLKKTESHLPFWMSLELHQSIQKTLENQKQVVLFLNRRGQSPLSLCFECGQTQMCPNCDISLTLHSNKYLICHYCNYSVSEFECSVCKNDQISHLGIGTQGVYSEIQKLFPKHTVKVADSDHVQNPKDFESLVQDMEERKIDILIGTQMIAKGFDFPHLHLVGLILADLSLYGQDYRSAERCFQTITQVGGRSGRHSVHSGQVVIQTYNPSHWVIQKSAQVNYEKMAEEELKHRKKLWYPPYCRLASIQVHSLQQKEAQDVAKKMAQKIRELKNLSFECLGPSPESIFKLRMRYRYHILIKSNSSSVMQKICEYVDSIQGDFKKVRIQINRDP